MRRGFTVLELLVASLLLSMLVTILTMIFNQSSVAWRTGIASVNDMETTRMQMGGYHDIMDDALPGVGDTSDQTQPGNRMITYRTVSVFRNWSGSGALQANGPSRTCSGRLIDQIDWSRANLSQFTADDAMKGMTITTLSQPTDGQSKGGYIVGVRSAGPNRKMEDEDDITTYPEEID